MKEMYDNKHYLFFNIFMKNEFDESQHVLAILHNLN